jgi:Tfp pilus assembly protein PilX
MKHTHRNPRQRGAALITGLILLAVITLLAVVGMNISNAELASATSEQLRMRAFQAAETGLEHGVIDVPTYCTCKTGEEQAGASGGVEGSPKDEDDKPIDKYALTYVYEGEGSAPGYSNKYASFHYSVQSEGTSARDTAVVNQLGAYVMNSKPSTDDFQALPE